MPAQIMPDDIRRVVACNYVEATSECREGALAYVILTNQGGGSDRIFIFARTRSGRWVRKWENIKRLGNFRMKSVHESRTHFTLPLEDREAWVEALNQAAERFRGRKPLWTADVTLP